MSVPKPQGMQFRHKSFTGVGDSDPSWNWLGIEQANNIIIVRATVNMAADGDVSFIAGTATGFMGLSPSTVPQGFAIITWGDGGQNQAYINDWNEISDEWGIPLHRRNAATQHVKRANWSSWEVRLVKLGANTTMQWTGQYETGTDAEIVVYGLAYIAKPITNFRRLGFKGTQNIANQSLAITYD